MEWYWIVAPAVVILIALAGWQWRLNSVIGKKIDTSDVSQKFHGIRNEMQVNESRIDLRFTTIEKDIVSHRFDTMERYVSKADLDKRLNRIDITLERQDVKLDTISEKLTTLSAQKNDA